VRAAERLSAREYVGTVPDQLPIFPLNVVAFPGMTVPLHVFEQRYRALVRHLLAVPVRRERLFGIVAIREGYEVGNHEARSMYRTGCVMQLTAVEEYDDGRFDIAVVGRHRMRVLSTDTAGPFLQAEVEHLPVEGETTGPATAHEAARTLAAFESYRGLVEALTGEDVAVGKLPRDPELLSYAMAATSPLPLPDRQRLLETATTQERLRLLRQLMEEEARVMTVVPSLPATEVARTTWNPN
jgi:hypothetical protein